MQTLDGPFPAYRGFAPHVPVHCVTPGGGGYIHRYYDSSPFSPSGRYLALTRLPFEDRLPEPGDVAEIVVVDLATGETRVVADTRGWDVQLGAQLQWGADDHTLLFNDLDTRDWVPFGVRLDPGSGVARRLGGTVYSVSSDGRWAASPCLRRMAVTQRGYGVVVPRRWIPESRGAPVDDGIWLTDLDSGDSRLLVSIAQIVEQAGPAPGAVRGRRGDWFGFHVKWNPQGTRSHVRAAMAAAQLAAMEAQEAPWGEAGGDDGRQRRRRPGRRHRRAWARGGHHPNWCPDGEHVLMNLNTQGDGLRFARLPRDGSDARRSCRRCAVPGTRRCIPTVATCSPTRM